MPVDRDYYIAKGEREPMRGLVEQAAYSIQKANEYKAELLSTGYQEAQLALLEELYNKVRLLQGNQHGSATEAQSTTREEEEDRSEVKAFIRKLRKLAPIVVRQMVNGKELLKSLEAGRPLGRSTSKLVEYLDKIRDTVALLDEPLKPYFPGESALATRDRLSASLAGANAVQQAKYSGLSEKTKDVYEAKGRLLEAIEDLNRIGQVTFEGRAEIAAQFNKDILLRARRGRAPQQSEKVAS